MKEHCDHIHSLFDGQRKGIPKVTVLGGLNNNYSGGELVFFTDEVYELKAGQVMVFPSLFLYPHRINTVTSGTRYSFAAWAW
jgi:predicted 2-oxoglutarate/Fe(II)-dependent dioxygenase YbiX